MKKMFALLLFVCMLFVAVNAVYAATETYTRNGYTLKWNSDQDPSFNATTKQKMIDTFFTAYPAEAARFNPNTAKTVSITIDPNYTGVAYTNPSGAAEVYSATYMRNNPNDVDTVTHESFHIVQNFGGPTWLTEGLTDYARYNYGVYNSSSGWSLPGFSTSQKYTDSYRVTARFIVWLEKNVKSTIADELNQYMTQYNSTDIWVKITGKTVDQLWQMYAQNPNNIGPTPTPLPITNTTPTVKPTSTLKPTSTPTKIPANKVFGYVAADVSNAAGLNSGFLVELVGTSLTALTDSNGCFEMNNAQSGTYSVKISKAAFLTRTINSVAVNGTVQIGTQSAAVDMWAGDVIQDNVVNMADIMEVSKCFNSVVGDGKYNANVDFNKDNAVNMADIMIITKHFNKTALDYPVFPITTQTFTPTPTSTPTSTVNPSPMDITEGGTITVSDNNSPSGEAKENAFDNNVNTKWLIFQSSGWIQYDFAGEDAYAVKSYSMASANDAAERDPKNWMLMGSNDGQNWITVDTRSNEDFPNRFQTKTYSISNTYAFKIYRLELTCDSGTILQLSEIQLFGQKGTPASITPKPTSTPTPTPTTGPSGDWSNFQAPTVVFQDQATGLEGSTIFHAAVPNVEQMMKDTCLEICKKIYNNNSEARNNFTKLNLLLTNEPNGVAWKAGNPPEITIGVSAQYLATFYHNNGNSYDAVLKEVAGILAHEGTHGYQYSPKNCGSYTQGTDFFGFIEGLADYTRTVTKGFTPPRYPRKGGTWTDGYNTTGFFIEWIVKNKKPTFAIELNRTAANYSTWSWDTACQSITGEGVQSLWNQYQQSIP